MSWAADGRDGNGLQLEKIGPLFSSLSIALCLGKLTQSQILADSLLENSLDI